MPKTFVVQLSSAQREQLEQLLASGTAASRQLTHARMLLKADRSEGGPAWGNAPIAEALEISTLTVTRVKKRFIQQGLEAALERKKQAKRKEPKLDGRQEAHLLALVCGAPPEGQARWTLRLLAGRMVELGYVEAVSHETVRQTLKKRTQTVAETDLVPSAPSQ
jgi:transposase